MLTIMALFNTGQLLEARQIAVRYTNWELTQLLQLDKKQLERIHNIHVLYERKLSNVMQNTQQSMEEKSLALLRERNNYIMEVLNDDQQKILYTYCTDMIFSEMVE